MDVPLSLHGLSVPAFVSGGSDCQEALAWVLLKQIEASEVAGVESHYVTDNDVNSIDSALSTYISDVVSWFDSAVLAIDAEDSSGSRGLPVPLPSLPPVLAWLGGGVPAVVVQVFLKIGVELILKLIDRWLNSDSENSLSDLVEVVNRGLLNASGGAFLDSVGMMLSGNNTHLDRIDNDLKSMISSLSDAVGKLNGIVSNYDAEMWSGDGVRVPKLERVSSALETIEPNLENIMQEIQGMTTALRDSLAFFGGASVHTNVDNFTQEISAIRSYLSTISQDSEFSFSEEGALSQIVAVLESILVGFNVQIEVQQKQIRVSLQDTVVT